MIDGPALMGLVSQIARRCNVLVLFLILLLIVGAMVLTQVREEG